MNRAVIEQKTRKHDYDSPWLIPMEEEDRKAFYEALGEHENFPSPGIMFQDFFPIFLKPSNVRKLSTALANFCRDKLKDVDAVIGLDARGFIFGPILALELEVPFLPVRKKGKLPGDTVSYDYELEYGNATVELQKDAVKYVQDHKSHTGDRPNVVIVDDLLATGKYDSVPLYSCKISKKIGAPQGGQWRPHRCWQTSLV
eukprot:gb/GECG01012964.1/.p1 GENE.gb/GECG01012964.1/~~gb/GECG01012964.1/.p1  ORF type:complete len:200 (+),score=24.33 gb/GECG01012964.1/:1-600(+)